jgi:ubiquitin carboxyl-terminal hydrolase 9/24
MLTPEFAKLFSSRVSELIVKRLQNMSEKEVKNCSKDQVEHVLYDLNQILTIGMTVNERSWVIETTELNIALRFLKSSNLEKRLKGLQDIKTMVERVVKTHRSNKIQQKISNWKSINDAENDFNKLADTGYFTIPLMYKWLKENKVIETIVGEGAHLEIVKRSESIISFVAKYTEDGKLDS